MLPVPRETVPGGPAAESDICAAERWTLLCSTWCRIQERPHLSACCRCASFLKQEEGSCGVKSSDNYRASDMDAHEPLSEAARISVIRTEPHTRPIMRYGRTISAVKKSCFQSSRPQSQDLRLASVHRLGSAADRRTASQSVTRGCSRWKTEGTARLSPRVTLRRLIL